MQSANNMAMKTLIIFLALLGISSTVFGAQKIEVRGRMRKNLEISKRQPRSVPTKPEQLLGLQRNEHLKAQEFMVTSQNTVKIKYTEDYEGLPVIGEAVVLEQTSDGQFTEDASGSLLEEIAEDVPSTVPALSAEDAFKIAQSETGRNPEHIKFNPDRDITLAIYTKNVHRETKDDQIRKVKAVLVYRITIFVPDPYWPVQILITIDANTGKVLHKNNLLEPFGLKRIKHMQEVMKIQSIGGNTKTGPYTYGLDRESLDVDTEDGIMCKLQNEHVAVVHMNFSWGDPDNLTQGYTFECREGINDSINGAYSPLSDAYFYFNKVYDMYNEWYKIKPLKHRIVVAVHYGKDYEDAFYDHYNIICFGDGKDVSFPWVGLGVMAHEISHGFTSEHSELEYSEQSGGMDEAFSDMASEAAQTYFSSKSDWVFDDEIAKQTPLRWLSDPPRDNVSVASLIHYCPGMDVHHSSGIFNKAFYLLANRPGWDTRKAFHVFLTANTLYWRTDSDFADGACGAVKAAKDLGLPADDVKSVFLDVDIIPCFKRRYHFQNLINTYISTKSRFEKYFDTSSISVDKMTIEVWINKEDLDETEETNYSLMVAFNGHTVLALQSNKSESMDIKDVQPGRYHITIEGEVSQLSVYVIAGHIYHGEITTEISSHGFVGNSSFYVDSTDVHFDHGMVIRASRGLPKFFNLLTGHGAPEGQDIDSLLFSTDTDGRPFSRYFQEVLYCYSHSGHYSIVILEQGYDVNTTDTFIIDAYQVLNLLPTI